MAAKAKASGKAGRAPPDDSWQEFLRPDENPEDAKVKRACKARQKKAEMKELLKTKKGTKYPLASLFAV